MDINIGKGITIPVDVESLPATALEHAIKIGLRNILMDSHAGVTAEKVGPDGDVVAESRAMAEKKLAALMAGEVRVAGTRTGDPVRAEAIRLAENTVRAAIRAMPGKNLKDYKPARIREMAENYLGKHPELLATAKANVAANVAAAAEVELD